MQKDNFLGNDFKKLFENYFFLKKAIKSKFIVFFVAYNRLITALVSLL
jgi:hypothetical protein